MVLEIVGWVGEAVEVGAESDALVLFGLGESGGRHLARTCVKTRQMSRLFHIDQATNPTYVQSTAFVSLT